MWWRHSRIWYVLKYKIVLFFYDIIMSNNDMIHEDKVAYLCEFAFAMGASNTKYKCDKIIERHLERWCWFTSFDYDDYLNFYMYVYDEIFPLPNGSLLSDLYSIIDTGIVYWMLDTFLSSYKKFNDKM